MIERWKNKIIALLYLQIVQVPISRKKVEGGITYAWLGFSQDLHKAQAGYFNGQGSLAVRTDRRQTRHGSAVCSGAIKGAWALIIRVGTPGFLQTILKPAARMGISGAFTCEPQGSCNDTAYIHIFAKSVPRHEMIYG